MERSLSWLVATGRHSGKPRPVVHFGTCVGAGGPGPAAPCSNVSEPVAQRPLRPRPNIGGWDCTAHCLRRWAYVDAYKLSIRPRSRRLRRLVPVGALACHVATKTPTFTGCTLKEPQGNCARALRPSSAGSVRLNFSAHNMIKSIFASRTLLCASWSFARVGHRHHHRHHHQNHCNHHNYNNHPHNNRRPAPDPILVQILIMILTLETITQILSMLLAVLIVITLILNILVLIRICFRIRTRTRAASAAASSSSQSSTLLSPPSSS